MEEVLNLVYLFAPMIFILVLANWAELRRQQEQPYQGLSITALVVLALFHCIFIALSIIPYGLEMARQNPALLDSLNQSFTAAGLSPLQKSALDQINSLPLAAVGLWVPALVGILLLLPPLRRLLARFLPMDAASPVHAVALSLSVLIITQLLVTLGVGLNNLAEFIAAQTAAGAAGNTLVGLWAQQVMTALFALLGVGWLVRRNWSATLQRIGLVAPSPGHVVLGIIVGLGMVPVVIVIEQLTAQFNIGVDPSVQRLTEQLLGPLFTTPFGIVTLGAAAALGEETLFRGAAQPRFGLVLTALLFALVHSNYGISLSTLIVFLFGLVLGVVRMRTNTTTTMIIHALYNMSLGLLAYLGF